MNADTRRWWQGLKTGGCLPLLLLCLIADLCPLTSSADIHYVDIASTNAASPYTNWSMAATVIQDAIDQAESNDTVLVADGVYSNGGKVAVGPGPLTNRVAITNVMTVRSMNGPELTFIVGSGVGVGNTNGDGAVRCVYLSDGASIIGFTLTNGHTRASGPVNAWGGGIRCLSTNCFASNCVIAGNSASWGGGAYFGTLSNCKITGNSASWGGGVQNTVLLTSILMGNFAQSGGGGANMGILYNCLLAGNSTDLDGGGANGSTLYNCSLVGNSAGNAGGGAYWGTHRNCISFYNTAPNNPNWVYGSFTRSCTTPLPLGSENITNVPLIVGLSDIHLLAHSPCINAGTNETWMMGASDADGEMRINGIVDMGADEYWAGGITGSLSAAILATYTQAIVNSELCFSAYIEGRVLGYEWDFGDGMKSSDVCMVKHVYTNVGVYGVTLTVSNLSGVTAHTVGVEVASNRDIYVRPDGNDEWAGTNWATAKGTIQGAVDGASFLGQTVWVTNGVYATGGRSVYGTMTNRVAVTKPITVRSVNGPENTFIVGQGVGSGGTNNGDGAIRCVYLCEGSALSGFILTNGHTIASGHQYREQSGGGIWCESANAVVSNCLLLGNSASRYGGGACYGTLRDCMIVSNRAEYAGGGAYCGVLYSCSLMCNSAGCGGGTSGGSQYDCAYVGNAAGNMGGGASDGILNNCMLTGNTAVNQGGGTSHGILFNCTLVGNASLVSGGGGADMGDLHNCTVTGNSAAYGGGMSYGNGWNCVVYHNTGGGSLNWESCSFFRSCTLPMPTNGTGNITNDPVFVDTNTANYRLRITSPCIDKGGSEEWMSAATDLDGNPRILNGTVDMGAYETPFYASPKMWLQGAYETNQDRMTAALSNNIPLTSPYKADARGLSSIPSNVTDWVLVQIRETNGNSIVSRSAFVNRDGYVLADNGSTGLVVDVSPGTNCYLVLQHRNHLAVMSAQPLAFTNILTSYDFTTNWSCYYGGSNAAVEVEPGAWGMAAGDADGDGKITETDRKIVEQQKGRSGYLPGDLNLDGVVE